MRVGILGGGQLGRMMLQAAANYDVETFVLESSSNCPAAHLCHHFVQGNITNYDDVYNFGKLVDALTIEIENVNVEALEALEKEGKQIFPKPEVLKTIKNKISQKKYYTQHEIPTAAYSVFENKMEGIAACNTYPKICKIGEGGYDGKGVALINNATENNQIFDAPGILEDLVEIQKEIAIMIGVSQTGELALYPPVWMVFDSRLHLLDYQLCPVVLPEKELWKLEALAIAVVKNFKSAGIFAVELFIDQKGNVLVNETAPRVHNSGHHTIEGNYCSQYDMLWRIILNYPLGNTAIKLPTALVNIIGEADCKGPAIYDGLEEVLKIEKCFVHLYGKKETKPGRKMGHVTIASNEASDLKYLANKVKHTLKVIS
jgi:5-(carboxyamino)imidazole ribonucleotide synthase